MSEHSNRAMTSSPFEGRSIQVVNDLSIDEQKYLYQYVKRYKEAIISKNRDFISSHIINDSNFSVYLLFQEDSTRTRESFFNAAIFHKVRTKDLSLNKSSLNKNENFTDTIKTLMGYAEQSCFVIRSESEGLCRWLDVALKTYASQQVLAQPFCINAGDGRNEHPTQEFLDEFTFCEYYGGDTSKVHIALIGDLLHGRTVHSKCVGLKIFNEVRVDLVAPEEIGMPEQYIEEMKEYGYEIRMFNSLEEYIAQKNQADIWYFTRLQEERISDELIPVIDRIRAKISMKPQFLTKIKDSAKFFHPLPRDKFHPTIPYSMDLGTLNGWDNQSINGYYIRITLLALLSGVIGKDFSGVPLCKDIALPDFIESKQISLQNEQESKKPKQKIGIKPVDKGVVIDHIANGLSINLIWDRINIIRKIMNLNIISSHGVYQSYRNDRFKGIISLPDFEILKETDFKKLGAISPGCTINIIKDSKVIKKMKIYQPPRIYNFTEISCRNPRCVSHISSMEGAYADFYRKGDGYHCNYCKQVHDVNEIWNEAKITY